MLYRLFLITMIPVSFVFMFAVVIFGAASMVALIPVFTLGYVLRAPWSLGAYFGGFMKLAAWPMGWVQDEMDRA